MANLKDKVIVITGAGGVLCSFFAKELAKDGAKIALLDLNLDAAKKYADEINAAGGKAIAVSCNVLEPEKVKEAHEEVKKAFGPCDILINGAGGNNPMATTTQELFKVEDWKNPNERTLLDIDANAFMKVFSINFMGTLIVTQEFAPDMVEAGKGSILNISSMASASPMTKVPAYAAAKAGITNFTKYLCVYFAECGIRVNAIAPGFFETIQNAALLRNPDGSLTERSHKILTHTPMKRFGVEKDLIGTVRYLLDDDAAAFVTGIEVPIDGGFWAYSGV